MKRVHHDSNGVVRRIPPRTGGALAQCRHCLWGRFFSDSKRKRYSAVARGAASLRAHVKREHPEKLPQFSDMKDLLQ